MWSLISFFFFATLAAAISATGNRVLAIYDDVAGRESYATFLGDLESRGFRITYTTPKNESLSLFRLGERAYDHVVFFPTKVKGLGPNLTPALLLQFIQAEGNMLVTVDASKSVPSSLANLLAELDLYLPSDRSGLVVDHFGYDALAAADMHDVLVLPIPAPVRPDVADVFSAGMAADAVVAFPRGMGALLGPSPLLTPVLGAPATAYSIHPKEYAESVLADELFGAGAQLSLVSAFQARNSARVTLLGAAEMLQDQWLDATVKTPGGTEARTANRAFSARVVGWTFQELGVLRVNWIEHRLDGANSTNPTIYRIKNDVTYAIALSEWRWDKWIAFTVPPNDALQLEFSMLSPYYRLPLTVSPALSTAAESVFTAAFRLPDQHGIFNFMVNYKRPLLTNVVEKRTVSVRHMAHDEWPRSFVISGAWPWIAGIGATVAGWVAFVAVWMYSAPVGAEKRRRAEKKVQ